MNIVLNRVFVDHKDESADEAQKGVKLLVLQLWFREQTRILKNLGDFSARPQKMRHNANT